MLVRLTSLSPPGATVIPRLPEVQDRMLGLGGGIEHAGLTPPEAPLCCGVASVALMTSPPGGTVTVGP